MMTPLCRDLCRHQAWADAEHWRAMETYPPAAADAAITNRLHHIHTVQRGFLWAVGDRSAPFSVSTPAEFATWAALKAYARGSLDAFDRFVEDVPAARLDEQVVVPWFSDPPLSITVTEALTQCAMHSHYHRGQNAVRLREIGGEPPLTDLIVWYWKGRPAPVWPG
jgi:uncharacterized damage-inducible protein DinB